MTNHSQGVYSPLPQSLSDSESEKEMPMSRPKFAEYHAQNGVHQNNGYAQPLEMMKIPEVHKIDAPMSPKRKLCFIISIAVCFLTIVVFLWVLPCSESGTCPVKISNWENQHEGIELTGKINVVKSAFKNTLNLALFFRRNINSADSQSGVISVLGNNGAIAWYVRQARTPTDLNCYLIDVNGDDINDCLVLGDMGLEAIDPISGLIFWHAHNHSQSKAMTDLDFPLRLQDLNHDNINELLATKNTFPESGKFVIISGKTGVLEGEINVEQCGEVHVEEMNSSSIIYQCQNEAGVDYHHVLINELLNQILSRSQVIKTKTIKFSSKPQIGYNLNGRKLVINNLRRCPNNCQVRIALMDEKTQQRIVSWSYQNSYALKPAMFSFKPTEVNLNLLKGHVNGFILKLWQWSGYNRKDKKRYNLVKRVPDSNSSLQVNSIMEQVVLITFNSTNFHVINASLNEITQLCFTPHDGSNCQPSLKNQNNSLLISDLDMDGTQELVSYSSTFVWREDLPEKWQLVSNMKVIRLEAELPKLYEVAK